MRGAEHPSCRAAHPGGFAKAHLLAVAYPWTFYLDGNNAAVLDVELLGAWNGINATLAHRSSPASHRRPYPRVPGEYPRVTPLFGIDLGRLFH